jgi:uncharacterized protein YjiS (DUF1127 family)
MKTANIALENEASGYSAEPMAQVKQKMAAARQTIRTWRHRARTRLALSQLSLEMLEDIGVEPGEARFEARKPFWRA